MGDLTYLSDKNKKKTTVHLAFGVFIRSCLAAAICFIIYFSVNQVFLGLYTKNIGYELLVQSADGSVQKVASCYYPDDTHEEERTEIYTDMTIEELRTGTVDMQKRDLRSDMPAGPYATCEILTQIIMLAVFVLIVHITTYEQGLSDFNLEKYENIKIDKKRGLKIGLLAAIPSSVFLIILMIAKFINGAPNILGIYKLLNLPYKPVLDFLAPQKLLSEVPFLTLLSFVFIPVILCLICQLGYFLGIKCIMPTEFIVYKKKSKK
ncbi:MAG: hypothetical protein RR177_03600 [Oscillospiraceae bacterium]